MFPYREPPQRVETERFKGFAYDELLKRDKVNVDIFWLRRQRESS
jgi:type I restriction enzyme M protein